MGPKKHLGQHFLTAPAFAKRIAEAVPASGSQEKVLEIGPGRGALSVYLLERFPKLHLVEIDKDAISALRGKLGDSGGYSIHNEDVMKFDFSLAGFPLHVVGNLPYNIGALIIKKTLLYTPGILSCTFMVQREVAERIVSGPNSKRNGFLSIFCQFFGKAKLLFHVPPGAFFPRPNVDSSVFQIIIDTNVESKLESALLNDFFSFVDNGFSMRRKQLAKTLAVKRGRDKEFYCGELRQMGMDPALRPEDLDVSGWLDLYKRTHPQ
ncbi:MAG: 16S rRNA (adenine(1518)-N(6)/adenine(1519)-N(6))-dimethyltransferase RsmA [Chitinispirillales bacterium]|jgi:16S rRNA (adenine1518-N6/adenine1519-N6)-dimethyltransferase|nr:16S rRNA (adenine(1518)-N(6)/adenine(1519)-N(6))-dimethyltransferase RsmA [Chitinispirillales bacterium]